jgi:hypothetical protein
MKKTGSIYNSFVAVKATRCKRQDTGYDDETG